MSDTEREALEAIANELRGVATERLAMSIAQDVLDVLQAAGWRRSPQPDAARVAEIRARLETSRSAWHTEKYLLDDIAYLLSLIPRGDR